MARNNYRKHLDDENARNLAASRNHRDVAADYPGPGDLALRAACEWDLRLFCESYFPAAFNLAWSDDHLRVIGHMQKAILGGGLFALAMPRASGKTTLTVRAAIWALLYGHRRFVCLIASTEGLARRLLKQFKTELASNELLARDHRQVCHAFRKLENNARKCNGQLFEERQTLVEWSDDHLVFPTMPASARDGTDVSGSIVSVAGLTGALRGQSHTLADGTIIRPELVILDDPQTRESAMSPSQSEYRADVIVGDVLGMGGPDQKITAIMPCTVIRASDMADTMLDRKKNPQWKGDKCKLLYSLPTNEKLWEQYAQIRAESFRADGDGSEATEFYRANREAMDAGAVSGWPARYLDDEISPVQHAMNIKIRDERAFWAEYQNSPLETDELRPDDLTADQVASKLNRLPRSIVPLACTHLTAFIDVQGSLLFYAVAGWADDFTGYLVDYGAWPDQKRSYFTLRDAKIRFSDVVKGAGLEGQIRAALESLTSSLLSRKWVREDGAEFSIERCLIDSGFQGDTVHEFCRQSAFSAVIMPSKGFGVGARDVPMRERAKKPGDRVGLNWRIPNVEGRRSLRHALYDTNFWKSFVSARLATAIGDRGSLSLFGAKPEQHRLLADHLTAEYRVRTSGRGREVDEWKLRPERPDNHWLDCLVGCAVAASIQGVQMAENSSPRPVSASKSTGFAEFKRRLAERAGQPRRLA